MSDILTLDEAIAVLPDGDTVHTFMSGGFAMLGADWPRAEIIEALKGAPSIGITGPTAQVMRHGMAIKHPRSDATLFIETARRTDEAPAPTEATT